MKAKMISELFSIVCTGRATPGIRSVIRRIFRARKKAQKTMKKSQGIFIIEKISSWCFIRVLVAMEMISCSIEII